MKLFKVLLTLPFLNPIILKELPSGKINMTLDYKI
ncbi:hypothetical protein ABIE50_004260 [Chitinophaga sp. OAE865]